MIRALILLTMLPIGASAQTYIATEIGNPCPPNSIPVKLPDGASVSISIPGGVPVPVSGWVCAATWTLSPLENPMPRNSK